MAGLTGELAKLLLEILGIVAVVVAVVLVLARLTEYRLDARLVAAVLGALTFAFALANVRTAGSVLNQARRSAVTARAGLEHCLRESLTGAALVVTRLPFVDWVKTQLPRHAVYSLAPYDGPPDDWCLTLVLLPALPNGPGGSPSWTIALGPIPPDLHARIARRDPSVQVFPPGYALARDAAR